MNTHLGSIIILLLAATVVLAEDESAFVQLNGKSRVQGKVESTDSSNQKFEAFRGIRYAKAPVGDLRFKAPQPFEYGDALIDGAKYGSVCPQISKSGDVIGNEDCLFLNVFVPKERKGPLPVMVYIHGGAFLYRDGSVFGPDYFMESGRVILVTLNYRIGSLGFLSLEDDTISGNMGIKDQIEALRWVKKHIKTFGGDDESITVFGHSAGGISVLSLLMSSHEDPGLFTKAIIQSCPMIDAPFMHSTHSPYYYSSLYAIECGCDVESTSKTLDCLKEVSMGDLVQKQHMFEKILNLPNPWKPVEDFGYASKPLFGKSFADSLNSGLFRKVPILIGGTASESAYSTIDLFANDEEMFMEISENFDTLGVTFLMGIDEADVTEEDAATANIIHLEYFYKENITYSSENVDKLVKMLTDVHFLGPVDKQVQLLANSSDQSIYYYNYRYRGSHTTGLQGLDLGASHGDELFLLFKMKDVSLTHEDKKVSESLIQYWTNFASEGSPSDKWRPVSNKISPQYAIIDGTKELLVKREPYFNERMAFVSSTNEIIKSYRNFDLESHPAIKSAMEREVEEEEEDDEEAPPPHTEEL